MRQSLSKDNKGKKKKNIRSKRITIHPLLKKIKISRGKKKRLREIFITNQTTTRKVNKSPQNSTQYTAKVHKPL